MELDIFERVVLLDLLPKQADYTTLKVIQELRMALSFTEEEHARWQPRLEGEMLRWEGKDKKGNEIPVVAEIAIGSRARRIIEDELVERDKQGTLHQDHMSLYEKFVVGQDG